MIRISRLLSKHSRNINPVTAADPLLAENERLNSEIAGLCKLVMAQQATLDSYERYFRANKGAAQ